MDSEDEFNDFVLKEVIDSSSSDDEDNFYFNAADIIAEESNESLHRGSIVGHRTVDRERHSWHYLLYRDYLSENPIFGEEFFRRRFQMRQHVFVHIMNVVEEHDDYFVQKRNAAGTLGLSCLQKVVAAFRMLAYGVAADAMDDYVRVGESTALKCLRRFAIAIVEVFGPEYLRLANEQDTARLLAIGESRGFLGMLGSIDCMHWGWKNCPTAWHGSHNGINVLQRSPIFARLAEDGIYPSWATFVKTIHEPQGNKKKYFAKAQEVCRKDVERAFGVLQSRFAIVRGRLVYGMRIRSKI